MRAGYGRACITPPIGTRMSGFGARDEKQPSTGVHDDLFVRLAYVEHEGEEVLIAGYDLLFFSRENADRLKGAVGRELDLTPRQILLNTSHTHVGACVSTWGYERVVPPNRDYLNAVEAATIAAAREARDSARPVSVSCGTGPTRIPVSRRRPDGKGSVEWRPYPEGEVCAGLPVCLLRDQDGAPVCLLYSVSCHPSTISGWEISADYPGVACRLLDEQLGKPCSIFLQGAGGDAKAFPTTRGRDANGLPTFITTDWGGVEEAGACAAGEVRDILDQLKPVPPALQSCLIETEWPLQPLPDRAGFEAQLATASEVRAFAIREHLDRLDRGLPNPEAARILVHGIQLAAGFRIVAVEGEMVGELGNHIKSLYPAGITMPLGYSNGTGLYLPSSRMIPEGGYEAISQHEYGYGAPLAPGMEGILSAAATDLRAAGVC